MSRIKFLGLFLALALPFFALMDAVNVHAKAQSNAHTSVTQLNVPDQQGGGSGSGGNQGGQVAPTPTVAPSGRQMSGQQGAPGATRAGLSTAPSTLPRTGEVLPTASTSFGLLLAVGGVLCLGAGAILVSRRQR